MAGHGTSRPRGEVGGSSSSPGRGRPPRAAAAAQAAFVAVFPSFDEVQSSPKAGAQSERLRAGSVSPLPKTASAAETTHDILALPTVFPAGSRPSLKELQTAIEELTKRNSAIQADNVAFGSSATTPSKQKP